MIIDYTDENNIKVTLLFKYGNNQSELYNLFNKLSDIQRSYNPDINHNILFTEEQLKHTGLIEKNVE